MKSGLDNFEETVAYEENKSLKKFLWKDNSISFEAREDHFIFMRENDESIFSIEYKNNKAEGKIELKKEYLALSIEFSEFSYSHAFDGIRVSYKIDGDEILRTMEFIY